MTVRYTVYQAEDGLWCLRGPDGFPYDGGSYISQAAAQASADRKNSKKVLH